MMMAERSKLTITNKSTGDSAADGVLVGLVAGVASGLLLVIIGLFSGDDPTVVLARFNIGLADSALVGGLIHMATSTVYGIGFGILYQTVYKRWLVIDRWSWLVGVLYGLLLLLIAEAALIAGIETGLREVPFLAFAAFHIVYGFTLGLAMKRTNYGG
jgi:hypothetical protein